MMEESEHLMSFVPWVDQLARFIARKEPQLASVFEEAPSTTAAFCSLGRHVVGIYNILDRSAALSYYLTDVPPPKDVRVETWLAAEIANTQAFDRVKLNLAEIPRAADLIVQHLRKPYGE